MTTKKRWAMTKNIDFEETNLDEDKVMSISQNVIIHNIIEQSLLDSTVESLLPTSVHHIYQSMMADLSFIKSTQIAKDCNFYQCNISFIKAEENIGLKRKAIIEFLTKERKKKKLVEYVKKEKVCQKATIEKSGNASIDGEEYEVEEDRPHRKRKTPSKFSKDYLKDLDECAQPVNKYGRESEDLSMEMLMSPKKVKQKKQVTTNSFSLKKHILADKLMLGMNCARQWTERGLYLTKVSQNELFLLNRRLSSAKCTMSDLAEHTDDNNNKSLSVMIKSSSLSNPTVATEVVQSSNDDLSTVISHAHPRSTKPHVSAMYRQRHSVPSILARPTLTSQQLRLSHKPELMLTFSAAAEVKVTEDVADTTTTVAVMAAPPIDHNRLPSDPSMSASRLLRLKSERSNNVTPIKVASNNEAPLSSTVVNTNPTIVYRTLSNHNHNLMLPLFLSPHTSVVPLTQRTFRVPLFQSRAGETTRSYSVVNRGESLSRLVPTVSNGHRAINHLCHGESQSTILKNLLQQSANSVQQRGTNRVAKASSSHMVPLSVFRNGTSTSQQGSMSHFHLKR